MPKTIELTGKQTAFCRAYVVCGDATNAAIKAGYGKKGAAVQGCRMLQDERIKAHIAALAKPALDKFEVTAERIMQEFARIAFQNPKLFYDEKGNFKHIHDLDDDAAAALASMESFEEYDGHGDDREATGMVRKIKTWDKVQALINLAKFAKMYPETNVKLSGTVTNRVVGLAQLLDELDGADTGTGPAKSRVAEDKTR